MLENHADQREMLLLFLLLFFTLLQRARRSRVIFLRRLDYSTGPKKTSCVTACICCFCLAGTSASAYRVGSPKASVLVWKLAQFKCFEHVVERKLSGYKWNIPFYLHGCCSCYPASRYYNSSSHTSQNVNSDRLMEVSYRRQLSFLWSYVWNCQVYC